jgi:AbrB family looped-hinge helix DNA binding protein
MRDRNITTVSGKGWIVIPKEIRDRYGLKPGDKVSFVDYRGISMFPAKKLKDMRGAFKEGPSLTEGLLEDRRIEDTAVEGKYAGKTRRKA